MTKTAFFLFAILLCFGRSYGSSDINATLESFSCAIEYNADSSDSAKNGVRNGIDSTNLDSAKLAKNGVDSNADSANSDKNSDKSEKISDEFIISYRAIVKDSILIGEEFSVVKALTKSKDYDILGVCELDIMDFGDSKNYTHFLKQRKEAILECLQTHTQGKISDYTKTINNETRTKTTFKIPPQRILFYPQDSKLHIIGTK